MALATINESLVMRAALQERAKDLKSLLEETAVEQRHSYGDDKVIKTPKYDVKSVDTLITKIKLAVFKIDAATKQSNAKTTIDLGDVNFEALMSPIENVT